MFIRKLKIDYINKRSIFEKKLKKLQEEDRNSYKNIKISKKYHKNIKISTLKSFSNGKKDIVKIKLIQMSVILILIFCTIKFP